MPKALRRLYHFMKATYALKAIERRRLKFVELDKTNDPYEAFPIVFNSHDQEENFRKAIDEEIQSTGEKSLIQSTGIICLSETYTDPTMWGHYAKNCEGICLGFDVICEEGPENSYAKRVRYVKERVDISHIGFNYKNDVLESLDSLKFFNLFLTKSHRWKHEKEWRICHKMTDQQRDPVTKFNFFPFVDVLELREILIGFRHPDKEDVKSRLNELVTQLQYSPKPEIFFTQRSLSTFDIEKVT